MDKYIPDPDELVPCPYDPEEAPIARKRLAVHLIKCTKRYLEDCKHHYVMCPYNNVHKILLHEFELGSERKIVEDLIKNTKLEVNIPSYENWDLELDSSDTNVLEAIKKNAADRGVLRNHQNMPPAGREFMRKLDHQKWIARSNAEERAKLNYLNTVVSTKSAALNEKASSSRTGLSSPCSLMSDSSFATALETATDEMRDFQVVKKERGRGRASTMSSSLAGLGRGRGRTSTTSLSLANVGRGRGRLQKYDDDLEAD